MTNLIELDEAKKLFNDIPPFVGITGKCVQDMLDKAPKVVAVDVDQYKMLLEMYNELRENFVDYVCSGSSNRAPYCLNKCAECVTAHGWCKESSQKCKGFNPAEFII